MEFKHKNEFFIIELSKEEFISFESSLELLITFLKKISISGADDLRNIIYQIINSAYYYKVYNEENHIRLKLDYAMIEHIFVYSLYFYSYLLNDKHDFDELAIKYYDCILNSKREWLTPSEYKKKIEEKEMKPTTGHRGGYTATEKNDFENTKSYYGKGYHNWSEMLADLDNILIKCFGFLPLYTLELTEWIQPRYKHKRDDYLIHFKDIDDELYSTRKLWMDVKHNQLEHFFIDLYDEKIMKKLKANEIKR